MFLIMLIYFPDYPNNALKSHTTTMIATPQIKSEVTRIHIPSQM